MIYCNLKGGLGNIMFQIASAHHLSNLKNTDCCFPNFENHLEYANRRWHLQYNKSSKFLNNSLEYKNFIDINYKNFSLNKQIKLYKYPFHYTPFLPEEVDFAIDGYFQTEKYFIDSRKDILNIFKPSDKINQLIDNKYKTILDGNTISVHVRRGDYKSLPDHHPLQPIEYYQESVKLLQPYDRCLIFSDDIEWCKSNIKLERSVFIENEKDYIEMFLMSKCDHNVIANSAFSWWGAWLNQKNNKVIAPKNWFGKNINHETKDVYCKNWIIL